MQLDWLESFIAFADTGNFTRAAERLHISQPALHVQIKRLGESLGVPLYSRKGRGLVITDQGRAVEAFAREIAERTKLFLNDLREGDEDAPVVVAAGRGTHLFMIADRLRAWVDKARSLSVLSGDQEFIIRSVLCGRAQIGVAPLDSVSRELDATLMQVVGQAAVVHTGHVLANRRRLTLAQLADHALILPPSGSLHRSAVTRAFQAQGLCAEVGIEAGGWELMMHYASLGLGAAIVNDYCLPPEGTRMIPVRELPTLNYHAFVRADGFLSPRAEELFAALGAKRKRARRS